MADAPSVEELRDRLRDAEEALDAVRRGEVDALVGSGAEGSQVFVLNALIEEMAEGAVALSGEGVILYANRRFAALVGAPLEDVVGAKFTRFVVPADQPAFAELFQAGQTGRTRGEILGRGADGTPVPLILSFSRLSAGSRAVVSVVVSDQTEARKKMDSLILLRDELTGRVARETASLALRNEELLASRLAALNMMEDAVASAEELKTSNEDLRRQIVQREEAEEEVRRLNAQLEERVLLRTSQLETANRELEAFSYSVSHDLRAPLRAIDGFAKMLLENYGPRLDAEGNRLLDVVRTNAQRMGQLIADLLSLSRAGRQEMKSVRFVMEDLVRTAWEELVAQDPEPPAELCIQALRLEYGDPALIRQVFMNLLSNALKFSSKRERRIVEVGCNDSGGETAYFVKDHGAGFDMRYVGKVFGVFQRLHGQAEFPGTGVGLSIVQRIVERHGGRVWAESEPGAGATFFFTLPREEERRRRTAATGVEATSGSSPIEGIESRFVAALER